MNVKKLTSTFQCDCHTIFYPDKQIQISLSNMKIKLAASRLFAALAIAVGTIQILFSLYKYSFSATSVVSIAFNLLLMGVAHDLFKVSQNKEKEIPEGKGTLFPFLWKKV